MVRSLGEATKELNRLVEKARRLLPLSRGGVDPNPQSRPSTRKPDGKLPRVKVMQPAEQAELQARLDEQSQIFIGPALPPIEIPTERQRRRDTREVFKNRMLPIKDVTPVTRREEDQLQRELQDMFDQLPTEGQQELAYLTLRESNETGEQDQTLENALARMAADRPRQFQRQNITPRKKPRKVSAYSKRFGIELKKLKKLHPRTKISALMKRAHRRTRAAMKKK